MNLDWKDILEKLENLFQKKLKVIHSLWITLYG